MTLKVIAAVAANGVIGRQGKLPWRLPDDLKWFKQTTGSSPVVMGRKTFEEIIERLGKPLPGRENIVLTSGARDQKFDGVTFIDNFDVILTRRKKEDIFVIGGAELYRLALPASTHLFLTRVNAEVEGDILFPVWNKDEWTAAPSRYHPQDPNHDYSFTWETYERNRDQYIEMANARTTEQVKAMQEIRELGVCPFCPEHRRRWHTKKDVWSGVHWVVSENMWPYKWSQDGGLHLVLFLKTHAENADQIPNGAGDELITVLREMENRFNIPGGGLYLRFGECNWTGGTIRHIHAHIAQKRSEETEAAFFL